jgi:hypothetical protein
MPPSAGEATVTPMTGPSLLQHSAAPEDPRQSSKVLHPLPAARLLVLRPTLAGADDLVEIEAKRPSRHAGIVRRLEDTPATALDGLATTRGDHGRIEVRRKKAGWSPTCLEALARQAT